MFHIRVNSCVANISDITFRTKSTSRKKLELCHYRISRSVNKIFSQSPLNSLQKACTCNWNWVHILNQQLHVRFTTYCIVIKCITLYSAKYKKKFSNLRHGKMPLFTVLLFHTPRLAENLKIFSINSWKSAQCMFYIRPLKNTTTYLSMCGRGNEVTQGKVTWCAGCCQKMRLFSGLFWKNIRYFAECQILQQCQTIGEIFFRLCAKLCSKKRRVLLCNANVWNRTHVMFPVILKQCWHFSVVQSFQCEVTT